jgi:hypothetical protein
MQITYARWSPTHSDGFANVDLEKEVGQPVMVIQEDRLVIRGLLFEFQRFWGIKNSSCQCFNSRNRFFANRREQTNERKSARHQTVRADAWSGNIAADSEC